MLTEKTHGSIRSHRWTSTVIAPVRAIVSTLKRARLTRRTAIGCSIPIAELEARHVEADIWPIVQALNQVPGTRTIASCHGHRSHLWFWWDSWPFVYFHAPLAFGSQLDSAIKNAQRKCDLRCSWMLFGTFHPTLGLCFRLQLDTLRANRSRLREDLAYLQSQVLQIGAELDTLDEPENQIFAQDKKRTQD